MVTICYVKSLILYFRNNHFSICRVGQQYFSCIVIWPSSFVTMSTFLRLASQLCKKRAPSIQGSINWWPSDFVVLARCSLSAHVYLFRLLDLIKVSTVAFSPSLAMYFPIYSGMGQICEYLVHCCTYEWCYVYNYYGYVFLTSRISGNFHWTVEDVAKSIICMIMSGPCLTGYTQVYF